MKKKLAALTLLLITAAVILTAGCVSSQQPVQTGDTVAVYYTLTVDGVQQETNVGQTPLTFVVGSGAVIKGFDSAVIGMKKGETKTVSVPPEEGYGKYTEEKTNELPLSTVSQQVGNISVGDTLYMNNGQYTVKVLEINQTTDTISAAINHHFAGKTLVFEITLVGSGK